MKKEICNRRQCRILDILSREDSLTAGEIMFKVKDENVSRSTINRDLSFLLENHFIVQNGVGRATAYSLNQNPILKSFDIDKYFLTDYRLDVKERYNPEVINCFGDIFTVKEKEKTGTLKRLYQDKVFGQTSPGIKKEFMRLLIEFSWKSSSIEGNTYSLLETEQLISDSVKAKGKSEEEAIIILNHKNAFEFIMTNKEHLKELSLEKIENIHAILTRGLGIDTSIRNHEVGVTGSNYKPLSDQYNITNALVDMIEKINTTKNPLERALTAVVMISYIQPFEDGNKRTGRMVGNAILMAYDLCPISYIGTDNITYKKSTLLFYEQNSIVAFKDLFMQQYELSIRRYF